MDFLQYTILEDDENRRLDRVLRKFLKDRLSLSDIYKSIRNGQIKVNNKKSKENYRTNKNDIIYINKNIFDKQIDNKSTNKTINTPKIDVIFENQFVKIINKPANISVQKSKKDEIALDDIIKQQYNPEKKSLSFLPGPLHRLDKKTTGLLVFSNNLVGAREFSKILQNHNVTKTYLTILDGNLTENQKWIDYISKDNDSINQNFKTVSVSNISSQLENGKEAVTEVFPIKAGFYNNKPITFAKIIIHTGRTHQIRSQCAFHGFPLLGDSAYNKKTKNQSNNVDFFLHSYSLTFFEDNILELPKEIFAPIPKNFSIFLKNYLSIENFAL
ncbi:MAG: RluA family pseudouridine synthase [Treponemataceae bacterium]|nr:RluA family pseudouridine synthase [Treponemataceae bacterium]